MKKKYNLLVFVLVINSQFVFSQQAAEKEKAEKMFDSVVTRRLTEEMHLSEQQLASFLSKYQESRNIIRQQRERKKEILTQLESLLQDKNTPERQIIAKLEEIDRLQEETQERMKRIREEMKIILTPEQRARFYLIEERLAREMVHALKAKIGEQPAEGRFWRYQERKNRKPEN
ncbi:MAG: hypothetical protein NC911_03235 [Candidatus Omnitrophica bacterium]|nr:hypothetical protein [Candidatus Omnitrophota bacterium]